MLGKRWNFKIVSLTGPAVNKVQDGSALVRSQVEASPLLALHQTPPAGRGRCIEGLASTVPGLGDERPGRGLTRQFRCLTLNCTWVLPDWLPRATVDAFTTDGPMPTPLPRLVVGIPEDTRQQLRALAAAHHRNISGEVIAALESWIEKHSDRAMQLANIAVQEAWKESLSPDSEDF